MKQKLMKIRLEKVQRTDLICIGCGNFRTEWAIIPSSSDEPIAGVHTRCMAAMHVKHARKKEAVKTEGESSATAAAVAQ